MQPHEASRITRSASSMQSNSVMLDKGNQLEDRAIRD